MGFRKADGSRNIRNGDPVLIVVFNIFQHNLHFVQLFLIAGLAAGIAEMIVQHIKELEELPLNIEFVALGLGFADFITGIDRCRYFPVIEIVRSKNAGHSDLPVHKRGKEAGGGNVRLFCK